MRTTCLTALVCLIVATAAYAAAPEKGSRYAGSMTGPTASTISFKVSKDGKRVSSLRLNAVPNMCAYGGEAPPQTARPAAIERGRFATTVRFKTVKGAMFATTRVTGRFLAGGRARGTLVTKFKDPESEPCNARLAFTATAR
jgi:hypothetical protein